MLTEKLPSKKRESLQSIALWDVVKNSGILDMEGVVGSSPIVITIYFYNHKTFSNTYISAFARLYIFSKNIKILAVAFARYFSNASKNYVFKAFYCRDIAEFFPP